MITTAGYVSVINSLTNKDSIDMKMKAASCVVFVENKSGNYYQAALSDNDMCVVLGLVGQLHGGTINLHRGKFPIERRKKTPKWRDN